MVAVAASVAVFGRECFDVSRLNPALLVPTWLYFFGSLDLIVMDLREDLRQAELSIRVRSRLGALLVLAIPLSFISSALACSGVIFTGCTPLCTLLARVWTPFAGLVAVPYSITRRRWVLPVIMATCLP